jgi:asparagine synthase (glutamine-hydrolysing)
MCGLAGLLRLDGAPADRALLDRMNSRLAHRGPDGDGLLVQGPLGLAHRRLSIIDLATGDQPMIREDLGRAIVFNGEIYNYLELRAELLATGHTFRTRSDTEVLLVAHAAWGDAFLSRLRGMFAFALWEMGRERLLLARDPLGKKPLHLVVKPGKLVAFASEAKALLELPEVSRRIEPAAIASYLKLLYVPEQQHLFSDLERLQPGEWLSVERGEIRRGRYTADTAQGQPRPEDLSFDEACARVDAALRRAVEVRLRSDVPLGVFLSGGIDSTLVALAAAMLVPGRLKTFTVWFEGTADQTDERPYARRVSEAILSDHTELKVELDAPALAAEVGRHFDEPFGDSSAVPMLAMSRETRKAVKVVLAGDGGDEIFGGYGTYLRHLDHAQGGAGAGGAGPSAGLRKLAGQGVALARGAARSLPGPLAAGLARLVRPLRRGLDSLEGQLARTPAERHLGFQLASSSRPVTELLAPLLGPLKPSLGHLLAGLPEGGSAVRTAMRLDRQLYLPGDILRKADLSSMRYGLEVRSPLLDDDLIALADRLPAQFMVDRLARFTEERWGKRILKALAARSLGEAFAYRPKQGFGAPVADWLRDPRFEQLARDGFLSPTSPIKPWFAPRLLKRSFRGFQGGKQWLAQEVWNLIVLDAWAREAKPVL